MITIRTRKNFVIKVYREFTTLYNASHWDINRFLPLITDIKQIETVAGFDYSKYWNSKSVFKQEASEVVYYALQRSENMYQVVCKNIADGKYEVVSVVTYRKIDLCVMIDTWASMFDGDLDTIAEPLPKEFKMVTLADGRRRLKPTTYGFKKNFNLLNQCPSRSDTEALAQNQRKIYE